jgi:hypothetical protein
MNTFSPRELKLIGKLRRQPAHTILGVFDACPLHSVCVPLPLFRIYKIDDTTFEAEWNDHHREGAKQVFRFEDAGI